MENSETQRRAMTLNEYAFRDFTIKPKEKPMENKDLIPFSVEKWESGEYEAVTEKENIGVRIHEIEGNIIYGRIGVNSVTWDINGSNIKQLYWNLMLRKKTKKVWYPLLQRYLFSSKEEVDQFYKGYPDYVKSVEVEL